MENQNIKQLAFRYFSGNISKSDEHILFAYISSSDKNKIDFRKWEKEWFQINKDQPVVEKEWQILQTRLQTRKAINPVTKRIRWNILHKIAAVAAVLLLAVGGFFGISQISQDKVSSDIFTLEAPDGQRCKAVLADGSIVWLNAGSRLQYPGDFNKYNRNVELDGEAYFEVTRHGGKPFTVKTREYNVVVKGTKFNISSYRNDRFITTTLMEGVVELRYKHQSLIMNPGQTIQLDTRSNKLLNKNNHTGQYKSWIDGNLKYDSITLEELLNRLSRQYNTTIHFESIRNKDRRLSISLKNKETLEEVLLGISKIVQIKVEYKGNEIYVSD